MSRLETAASIINDVALEVGLLPVTDPYASSDQAFIQFQGLLNAAGRELVKLHNWQNLMEVYNLTTVLGDSGNYDLPDDFDRMINQTGWDLLNRVPVGGPLGAQDWAYLEGRDLVSQSIYASFRLRDNQFVLFPQPPSEGIQVRFQYISRYWVEEGSGDPAVRKDRAGEASDIVLFDPTLVVKFLKVKFLSAKGLDITAAAEELDNVYNALTGQDEGAPILSAGRNTRGFPYITPYYNTSDSWPGLVP